ncbi:hypothetical protein ACRALDRAFT_2039978 [Sodiomyces alcalophilus JCM 7366]|uniref:uncharacterized protein n=1 Tax=Sodiomyces alcalophilus JCM 7366 TaxID=591952 RepID=UPI0039B3C39B
MTIKATKFTPEVLLSAPRRSAAIPNPSGDKAIYTVSTYSFQTHSKTSQFRVLDIGTGNSSLLYEHNAYSDPNWVDDELILFLKKDEDTTYLMLGDVATPLAVHEIQAFNGSLSNLKVKRLSDDRVAIVCSAVTTPSGTMYDHASHGKPHSSARVYSELFPRHWDQWTSENRNSLWYGLLTKKSSGYHLQEPGLVNALRNTRLECPVPPFGDAGDFDISHAGLAFVARDPDISPAIYTKTDVYVIPLRTFTEPDPPPPQIVQTGHLRGYSNSPVFSQDGKRLAFTRMRDIQYESDKPRLMLIPDISDLASAQEFYATTDEVGGWDARPEWVIWGKDDAELYVAAEHHGRNRFWKLPSSPDKATDPPESIFEKGTVVNAVLLGNNGHKLLVSSNSVVDNSCFSLLDPSSKKVDTISSSSKHGKSFGLSEAQFDEFWFKGAEGYDIHALVVKPSDFDPSKTYPLAFLIHGGPQSAWRDSWSTRWNPAVFAEQGYVVVLPNPTGSTGYGQAHVDAIQCDWGGRPYVDLVKCFEHIEREMAYIDTSQAVALGASYGGYMINWIQGHDFGRKFKALVCHNGVFSTMNQWSTEELFFTIHDFGGPLWEKRDVYEKWDPATRLSQWATPQLVIHNELDYRLPISEGLAMFNVLQARGVPSRLLVFPDENHWVLKPENSLVWHKEVLGWINKYSGINEAQEMPEQSRS